MDFGSLGLAGNVGVFAVAAVAVWIAGTKMSRYADEIADRTGLGKAFIGFVLLAVATSLPEVATTATAALRESPRMVTNNLLGGVVMQTAVLAVADLALGKGALTWFTPRPALLFQGVVLMALLGLTVAGIAAGPLVEVAGMSLWTALLLALWVAGAALLKRIEGADSWRVVDQPEDRSRPKRDLEEASAGRLGAVTAACAAALLVAGWAVASSADVLAERTGLGQSFVGATFVAVATSLPEVSTTLGAVRLRAYDMAVSNIFGSNMTDVTLLFLGDAVYRRGPLLDASDDSALFAAATGILVTAVYVGGVLARSGGTVGRLGFDSVLVLVAYAGFVTVSYLLR